MLRTPVRVLVVAGLILLAGCAGGLSGVDGTPAASPTPDGAAGDLGTVTFYVSDEPNAIERFEHLTVTVTAVGFQQAGDDDGDETDAEPDDAEDEEGETETPEAETGTPDDETETSQTETDIGTDRDAENEFNEGGNERDEAEDGNGANERDEAEDGDDSGGDESGGWVEYTVTETTVDLTALRGANATMIEQFDVPNGTYNTVFVHVGQVNATLTTGESVNVKLPSQKLQLDQPFTVGSGSEVEFVFDIAVHEAGNSGKYILKPVVGESGTDVPIRDVDGEAEEGENDEGEQGENDEGEEQENDEGEEQENDEDNRSVASLEATFVGTVTQGEDATVAVTSEGDPVANATVTVGDEPVGTTDTDGRITFSVPDSESVTVEIRRGDAEAELEREFESDP
jgi:hypothetical protein